MVTIVNIGDEVHKSYLRLSVPQRSGFGPVEKIDADEEKKKTLDIKAEEGRKEAGLYVEIDPGQTSRLIFSWEGGLPFDYNGKLKQYWLALLKQPGVSSFDTGVKIKHKGSYKAEMSGDRFLTGDEVLLYNSSLLTDEVIKLTFD